MSTGHSWVYACILWSPVFSEHSRRTAFCETAVTCFGLLSHTFSSFPRKRLKQGKWSEKKGRKGDVTEAMKMETKEKIGCWSMRTTMESRISGFHSCGYDEHYHCIVTPRSLREVHRLFAETYCLHLQVRGETYTKKLQDQAPATGSLFTHESGGPSVSMNLALQLRSKGLWVSRWYHL
jgi:hypothetical protein